MTRGLRRTRTAPIACAIGFRASGLKAPLGPPNAGKQIAVRQIRPGLRARAAFIVGGCDRAPSACCGRCRAQPATHDGPVQALIDLTQNDNRRIDFHELAGFDRNRYAAAPTHPRRSRARIVL